MTPYTALVVVHVVLVTAGYIGLIAANVWLLLLCRGQDAVVVARAVKTWRRSAQIFGPTLGVGVLAGFALALVMGVPLSAAWLVASYVLIVLALAAQAAIMIPWELRADKILARGDRLSTRPVVIVLSIFSLVYVGIVSAMLFRPM